MKRVVDDSSTLAVLGRLTSLLRSDIIHNMSEEEIFQLASETEDVTNQREECMDKLAVLRAS